MPTNSTVTWPPGTTIGRVGITKSILREMDPGVLHVSWPQWGNGKVKHYTNNGMYGAQIPKGHQTNVPYSKSSTLECTVEGAQHVVCGNIS